MSHSDTRLNRAFKGMTGKRRTALLLSVLVTVFIVALALEKPAYIEKFELAINDIIYNLGVSKGDIDDIVIVAIDNQSVNKFGRWPWRRNKLAELISGIALRNPRVIGLDILLQRDFEEDTLGNTAILASAINAAGNVVAPFYFTLSSTGRIIEEEVPDFIYYNSFVLFDNPTTMGSFPIPRAIEVFSPAEQIGQASSALGHVNLIQDIDGRIRWEPLVISYDAQYFPSFALQVSRVYLGLSPGAIKINGGKSIQFGSKEIHTDASMRIPIKYSGGYNTFKYISALDVFEGNLQLGTLENKVVLVGYVAADNRDVVSTPVTEILPGVEKQASVIENIINANILKGIKSNAWINLFIILLFGLFGAFVFPRVALHYRLIMILGSIFLLFNIGYYVFTNFEMMLQFFYPALELIMFLAIAPLFGIDKDYPGYKPGTRTTMAGAGGSQTIGVQTVDITQPGLESTYIASAAGIEQMGRYKIEGVLGKGAMGTVYKGIDPAIGRPVAIKTIRIDIIDSDEAAEEMLKRLTAEAHSAGKLSHPNIITIYDVGRERNLQYIAMEYLEGRTLEEMLKEKRTLDFRAIAQVMAQTADALAYAHKENVVHRDIKPANIMVQDDGNVKVMDFGIARTDNMHMTQTGITVGTPNYISPEQLQGGQVDGRTDIFSAGIVLYEALTGEKPFHGDNISTLVVNILNHHPPKPSEVNSEIPPELDRITMKALQKDCNKRYQNASGLADDLNVFLGEKQAASEDSEINIPVEKKIPTA